MKETYYFSHDYNAHNDPKIMNVFMEVGLCGIGLYWIIIEILHQEESGYITIEQFTNFVKLYTSQENKGSTLVEQLLNTYFTNDLLVKTDDGLVYSKRVLENKKIRKELSEKRSLAGKKSASIKGSLNTQQVLNTGSTNAQQGKERKGKERKGKGEINLRSKFVIPSVQEIKDFCLEKGYTVSAEQFYAHYQSKGRKVGKNPMVDRKAGVTGWQVRQQPDRKKLSSETNREGFSFLGK